MKLLLPACFVLLLFFCSCEQLAYVNVPVEYTPGSYFNKDSTTVVLINQFDADRLNISNKKNLDAIKSGAYTAIKAAEIQLNRLPRMKIIRLADSAGLMINTDSVKLLAQKYKASYVLALKNFNAAIEMNEQNSETFYSTNVGLDFLLYEKGGVYYKRLYGFASDLKPDEVYMSFMAMLSLQPAIGKNMALVDTASVHAVQNAFQSYFPYTITNNRPLYNDKIFKPAVTELLAGNLEKADSLLRPFLKNKNKSTESKAAYNLAVVYELEGDIQGAINMAKISSDNNSNELASVMLYSLRQE